MYYNLSTYDYKQGGGYGRKGGHPAVGQTRGQETTIYTPLDDVDDQELDDSDEEVDTFVDDLISKIRSKTDSAAIYRRHQSGRKDRGNMVTNVGGYGLSETLSQHTNTAVKGISPRLTYRSKNKGPAFGAQAAATYIKNAPGRKSGTQYGTSRAHKLLTDIEDESIFNLDAMLDPMERSFHRQQNRIRKLFNSLNNTE